VSHDNPLLDLWRMADDQWAREFMAALRDITPDEVARYIAADMRAEFTLQPLADTGDERHGDWEYGPAERQRRFYGEAWTMRDGIISGAREVSALLDLNPKGLSILAAIVDSADKMLAEHNIVADTAVAHPDIVADSGIGHGAIIAASGGDVRLHISTDAPREKIYVYRGPSFEVPGPEWLYT
jgi:hypothetical protein